MILFNGVGLKYLFFEPQFSDISHEYHSRKFVPVLVQSTAILILPRTLLLLCGDIELNPGPLDSGKKLSNTVEPL